MLSHITEAMRQSVNARGVGVQGGGKKLQNEGNEKTRNCNEGKEEKWIDEGRRA